MAMLRRIVTLGWVLSALAIGWGTPSAHAAGNRPGSSCGNGSVSALNQYCEQIPSATGRQTPRVGTAALGSTPAASAIGAPAGRAAARGRVSAAARERLRSLPAGVRAHPIAGSVTGADIWSLSLTLILVLVALALALIALAFHRWRRDRPA
jgi:hypothetical protein